MIEQPLFRSPKIFSQFKYLVAAESTRHGGVSTHPYLSLNLGGATNDAPENVEENNLRFFSALNIPLAQVAKSHQVHSSEILNVQNPGRYEGYDALITNKPNIQLAVTIADCTPVLIYDPVSHAVAAIHAGWKGTMLNIVLKTVQTMQKEFGSDPKAFVAYVGTCIDECSFEVGEEVAINFDSEYKRWDAEKGKFFIDLKLANKNQLLHAGLNAENIEISACSTVLNNNDYFSYRLEKGLTGRMLATIGMTGV
ncbi:peptidoglycan editing factor PgeF [Dyadobacter sp. NIV53]|uniref:peptidoglycan editing factor PgeF n=1 Tax=Dyadobacter sp. NIV53 TaxID=2861765 RepID=UPI001C873B0D|nr:peptidoglycan editing factor PgeF [Dyadobacter sp. NIV53]